MPGALDGIRIIEWGAYHAGPGAGGLMAALGAEVIKLEQPGTGDPARHAKTILGVRNQLPNGYNPFFEVFNRGKKSLTLDLKNPASRDILHRLVAKSDVFLATFRPAAAKRLGVDYERLRTWNEKLIYVSLTTFGPNGPDSGRPGFDSDGLGRAGMMFAMRNPSDGPYVIRGLGDEMGSISTAYAILAAICARERQGISQQVHTSILGGAIWVQATLIGVRLGSGQDVQAHNQQRPVSPIDTRYQAGDGKWMTFAADNHWEGFCGAAGQPELVGDPRYATPEFRRQNSAELTAHFNAVFATKPRAEWLEAFRQYDVPASPVNTHAELFDDPQITANDYVVAYDDPRFGRIRNLGSAIQFEETPANVTAPSPALGEHSEEILIDLLGYSEQDVQQFKAEEVT